MNNDEYFKKLNQKANEEPKTKTKFSPRPKHKLFQPYGFATYLGMTPQVAWTVFLYCMVWFFLGITFITGDMKLNFALWCEIAASGGGLLVLIIIVGYFRFRGWVERLPFKLEGWTELIHAHKMNKQKYYRMVTLTVTLKPGTSQHIAESINNAIKILNNKQNRWIRKDRWNDGRKAWKTGKLLSTSGTVNNIGIGRIKTRLQVEFSEIQNRTAAIEKIVITYDKTDFTWEPPTDTMS